MLYKKYFKVKTKRKTKPISRLIEVIRKLFARENLIRIRNQVRIKQKVIANFVKEHRTIKILHLFRNYSAFTVVVSSAFLVSATNLAAGRESSGFLFGYFGENENYENPLKDMMFLKTNKKTSVAVADLAQTKNMPNTKSTKDKIDDDSMIIQGQALVAGNSPVKKDPQEGEGVIIYEVKKGDTVSGIARANHISVNTILWSNELDNVDEIMPGDKIFILPVSGLEYVVKKGDTIKSIASKYKAVEEKIIAFNDLPANGDLEVGQKITIPDGQKEVPVSQPSSSIGIAQRQYDSFSSGKVLKGKAGTGHRFPYGYCTWYVAQRRYVPWGGNAGTWLYHAKAAGYATGKKPRVGAIMVSSESWWGHVAIVEKVKGSTITVSEMNYAGFAKKSTRTLSSKSRAIKGFIY